MLAWAACTEAALQGLECANLIAPKDYSNPTEGSFALAVVRPYISTNATVRDLDRLRESVGDAQLTYWETSYGTRIGYIYAHDFPDRVRAMLLTSPISPNATWPSFALGAATAPDDATHFFLGKDPLVRQNYERVIAALNAQALILPSSHSRQWPPVVEGSRAIRRFSSQASEGSARHQNGRQAGTSAKCD